MRKRSSRPVRNNCTSIRAMPRANKPCIPTIPPARSTRSRPASGNPVGVSTGWWIAPGRLHRQQQIRAWRVLPDYVSVNLIEEDASDMIELVLEKGIGVEVGLWSAADAEKFVADRNARHCLRVLIEINEQEFSEGAAAVRRIIEILDAAHIRLPRLLHGFENTMWSMYREALRLQLDGADRVRGRQTAAVERRGRQQRCPDPRGRALSQRVGGPGASMAQAPNP